MSTYSKPVTCERERLFDRTSSCKVFKSINKL
jgi:hypothetical protein